MGPEAAFDLEIAAVVAVALLIVAVAVVASGGACEGDAAGTDVESAMGGVTLTTYGEAAKKAEEEERCAICLSEYAKADELVRVVPVCGHFFHAECGVDRWLRARGTCPICRVRLWPPSLPMSPLPRIPRPECPTMPPRAARRPSP